MANEFVISRVNERPGVLSANTMYIIKEGETSRAKILFTGHTSDQVAETVGWNDVDVVATAVAIQAIEANRSVFVVADIAAMNALAPATSSIVFVKDTTADPLAKNPTGAYVYDFEGRLWLPLPSGQSGAQAVDWSLIINGPVATPGAIDAAVANSHSHANQTVLDNLTAVNGKLAFNGTAVSEVAFSSTW